MASELPSFSSDCDVYFGEEDILLSESHIPCLMEVLVEASHKWEELGIAIGLPRHVISQCKHDRLIVALNNILHEWVSGNYKGTIPATLKNMKLKLASQTVGEGRVALKLQVRTKMRQCLMSGGDTISSMAEHLRKMYSRRREVPRGTWPPVGTNVFISLVLNRQSGEIDRNFEYSVRGNIDDIIKNKERVSYESIFSTYIEGGLLLVEGRPGSGKTTLVHKIARDWASGGDVLTNAKLVFLIPLHVLDPEKSDHTLSDLLKSILWNKSDLESVCRNVTELHGKGVCFILDGLDEYKQRDSESSVVYALTHNTHKWYLPDAMVIMTSRPVATTDIRRECTITKYIEVIGFSKEQIHEYIDKFPFSHPGNSEISRAENLETFLEVHQNVLYMCYLPVHAAMICFLHQYSKAIPYTETKIYEEFTRLILLRYLRHTNKKAKLPSLHHLPEKETEWFRKICQLAFNMCIQSKQVIYEDDTDVSLSPECSQGDECGLGLVTIDHTVAMFGFTNTYTFLHLTLQEYLAAYHIANLAEDEQEKIFSQCGKDNHMSDVLVFYCGMTFFTEDDARLDIVSSSDYSLRCAFESQQLVVCDSVVGIGGGIRKYGQYLALVDVFSMVYIIVKTSRDLQWLEIVKSHFSADKLKYFVDRLINFDTSVLKSDLLGKLALLNHLDLSFNSLGGEGVIILVDTLNDADVHLRSLRLVGNSMGTEDVQAVIVGLKCHQDIEELDLRGNCIDGVAVWSGLKFWTNLKDLYLGRNTVDVASLVTGIVSSCNSRNGNGHTSSTLKIFDVDNCVMNSTETKALLDGLMLCTELQEVNLSGNIVCSEGVVKLCDGLKCWHELNVLSFVDTGIGTNDAVILAEGLKNCSTLEKIDLSYNNIGADGAIALAKSLKNCSALSSINLHDNLIGSKGALALSEELKSCPQLNTLCLYDNTIDSVTQTRIMNMFDTTQVILQY